MSRLYIPQFKEGYTYSSNQPKNVKQVILSPQGYVEGFSAYSSSSQKQDDLAKDYAYTLFQPAHNIGEEKANKMISSDKGVWMGVL